MGVKIQNLLLQYWLELLKELHYKAKLLTLHKKKVLSKLLFADKHTSSVYCNIDCYSNKFVMQNLEYIILFENLKLYWCMI